MTTKTILALIRPDWLTDANELIVASAKATDGATVELICKDPQEYAEWSRKRPTEAFQTSKDLKTLEKELKKNMAVELHEKEQKITMPFCASYGEIEVGKKPLMLAVFGDRKTIEEMV